MKPLTYERGPQAGQLKSFKRTIRNNSTGVQTEEFYQPEQVAWTWLPALDREVGPGVAPVEVAMDSANIVRSAKRMVLNAFDRGGVKATILFVDDQKISFDEEKAGRLESRFAQFIDHLRKGIRQAFEPLALRSGVEVKEFGSDMQEADTGNLTQAEKEDIAVAMGIPFTVLYNNEAGGLGGGGVQDAADLSLYKLTVTPEFNRIADSLNRHMFTPEGLELVGHPDRLEVMQTTQLEQAQAVSGVVGRPILTPNEGRALLGYEPVEDGDRLFEPERPGQLMGAPVLNRRVEELAEPEDERADELRTWRRMALRRWSEGNPGKALEFQSDILPAATMGAVIGALETARDEDHVKAVFADALTWCGYP